MVNLEKWLLSGHSNGGRWSLRYSLKSDTNGLKVKEHGSFLLINPTKLSGLLLSLRIHRYKVEFAQSVTLNHR